MCEGEARSESHRPNWLDRPPICPPVRHLSAAHVRPYVCVRNLINLPFNPQSFLLHQRPPPRLHPRRRASSSISQARNAEERVAPSSSSCRSKRRTLGHLHWEHLGTVRHESSLSLSLFLTHCTSSTLLMTEPLRARTVSRATEHGMTLGQGLRDVTRHWPRLTVCPYLFTHTVIDVMAPSVV
ncbi:hypothetical protein LY78DRAFT_150975 [Colletotrichum sublineola]|nr:hypothetical protein LY78DRAFT_150975 [Colletotrichum sublineola]